MFELLERVLADVVPLDFLDQSNDWHKRLHRLGERCDHACSGGAVWQQSTESGQRGGQTRQLLPRHILPAIRNLRNSPYLQARSRLRVRSVLA